MFYFPHDQTIIGHKHHLVTGIFWQLLFPNKKLFKKRRIFISEVVYIFINIIYNIIKKYEYKFFFSKEDFMEGK